jgi:hypothetical protein
MDVHRWSASEGPAGSEAWEPREPVQRGLGDALGRAAAIAGPPATYLAGAVALFHSAWRHPFTTAIGDGGDTFQNVWWLAWMAHALTHGINPFFTTYMDYPAGVNLLWNTSDPLMGTLLTPLTLALGPVFAFNVLMTLGVALSAWTAHLLCKRIVGHPLAAWLGGLVYGFSPFMVAHSLGHPQLTTAFLPPLVLLVVHELVVTDRPWALLGAGLGVLGAMQLMVGEELLAITALTAGLVLAIVAAASPQMIRPRGPRVAAALLVAGCVFAVLAAAPLALQFLGPRRLTHGAHPLNLYVSDALSFFVPTAMQQFAPHAAVALTRHFTGDVAEWDSYVGIPLALLLVGIAVLGWRSAYVRVVVPAALVVCIWSMGVTFHRNGHDTGVPTFALGLGFLPFARWVPDRVLVACTFLGWFAMANAPVLENILSVRLMVMAYLLIGILVAIFAAGALRAAPRWRALGLVAVLAALVPLLPTFRFPSVPAVTPAFFSSAQASRIPDGSVAVVLPFATPTQQSALLWQAESGMRFRQTGGYAIAPGATPNEVTFEPPASALRVAAEDAAAGRDPLGDPATRSALTQELAQRHVRTVILGPMAHQERVRAMLTRLLGQPQFVGGVWVWSRT